MTTSIRRRIEITRQLFQFVMGRAESSVNEICSRNGLIYFCSEVQNMLGDILILNIMGFDKEQVVRAAQEVLELFQQFASFDGLHFPKDLDAENGKDDEAGRTTKQALKTQNLSRTRSRSLLSADPVPNSPDTVASGDNRDAVFTPNGIKIRVSYGHLVKQQTEAIVCITNCRLQCAERSSQAVVAAVGCRHAEDCSAFLRLHGSLKPCQVMHTDAGNLWFNIRHIIHVAEPRLEDLNEPPKQHTLLEDLYFNTLHYTNNQLSAKSVSVPFFTNDSCKINSPVTASAICKAILKFDHQPVDSLEQRALQEVNVVCCDHKTVGVQMITFDIFLPRLRSWKVGESVSCANSSQTAPKRNQTFTTSRDRLDENLWWKEQIKSHFDSLELEICLESGLEGELISLNVLEAKTLQYAMEKSSRPQKVQHLLNSLLQGDDDMFESFCRALEMSGQKHIVTKYLTETALTLNVPKGGLPRSISESAIHEDLKLLPPWKIQNLRKYHNELVDTIISDCGLIAYLQSLRVFTDHQLAELQAEKHETTRNQLMLKWLEKCSEGTHRKFCAALGRNKQEHLVTNFLLVTCQSFKQAADLEKRIFMNMNF